MQLERSGSGSSISYASVIQTSIAFAFLSGGGGECLYFQLTAFFVDLFIECLMG